MKSSIKIELMPISGGGSLEPVIKVKISSDTSDIRDYALQTFFQTQGYDSNILVVRRTGAGHDAIGDYSNLEIYPVKDLLVEVFPDSKECGIPIGDNEKHLRDFLDERKNLSYTNNGQTITLFNIQNIWSLATEYGIFLQRNNIQEADRP